MTDVEDPSGEQLSPEQLQAYLSRLREADVSEIVAQAWSMLATGAEVKLGRPDARVLIDAMAAVTQAVGARLAAGLSDQMRAAVTQMQMAQVDAERQAAAQGPAAGADQPAQAGPSGQADRGGAPQGQGPGKQPAGQRMTDRLWIPGRDPGPPPSRP